MRAALYARYSSDLQNAKSAEDQLAHLRRALVVKGWTEAASYKDEGISGATLLNRPGLLRLLADARERRFDVLFAEAMDRVSRDQADTASIYKQLEFLGIKIHTTAENDVGLVQVGFAGIMNQMFLAQLGEKTLRGQIASVRAGRSGGGKCYGYTSQQGTLAIEPDQAQIIRRIFEEYASGRSPRDIAYRLNAEGVPGPRKGEWSASSINGDRRVGDGILHQTRYHGETVFNRRHFRKHPETGRRSSIINPQAEWVREEAPDLRIVDDALWFQVQRQKAALGDAPKGYRRRPARLLSGLLSCGTCGGSMVLQGRAKYGCSAHRERGTCANSKIISATTIEGRVLAGVKDLLLAPEVIDQAMRAYERELADTAASALGRRARTESDLSETRRKIERLLDLYEKGVLEAATLQERIAGLESKRNALTSELEAMGVPPVYRIHPRAVDRYRALVEQLHLALAEDDAQSARESFRGLLDGVVFLPRNGRGEFELELHGRLSALLDALNAKSPHTARTACGVMLGAGTGFEPVTFRL